MWLEEQLKNPTSCAIMENVRCIRREAVLDRIRTLLLVSDAERYDGVAVEVNSSSSTRLVFVVCRRRIQKCLWTPSSMRFGA